MDALVDMSKELFEYNRGNYNFDKKLGQEREYQEQEMRLAQFDLYREDIDDLQELTTGKMDAYLPPVLLMLGCAALLLVHGVMNGTANEEAELNTAPGWLVWVYMVTLAQAFLFLFMSGWLAIHASVTAHSYGVRMLTQYVRLPVPRSAKIEAARAYGSEFEGSAQGMFRLPVLRQQVDNIRARFGGGAGPAGPVAPSAGEVQRMPTSEELGGTDGGPENITSIPHIKRWREMQGEWQAHDAYARASLAIAAYSLNHALAYYLVELFVIELQAPWAALGSLLILQMLAWLLTQLDLYFEDKRSAYGAFFLVAGPTIAFIGALSWVNANKSQRCKQKYFMENIAVEIIVPALFLLNCLLILAVLRIARAEAITGSNKIDMPNRFRTVLYLDVFGWLGQSPTTKPKQTGGPVKLPGQLQNALLEECHILCEEIQRELNVWQDKRNAANLKEAPAIQKKVNKLHKQLEAEKKKLHTADDKAGGIGRMAAAAWAEARLEEAEQKVAGTPAAGFPRSNANLGLPPYVIWLRFVWEKGSQTVEWFAEPTHARVEIEPPPSQDAIVSDIEDLSERMAVLHIKCVPLQSHTFVRRNSRSNLGEPARENSYRAGGQSLSRNNSYRQHGVQDDGAIAGLDASIKTVGGHSYRRTPTVLTTPRDSQQPPPPDPSVELSNPESWHAPSQNTGPPQSTTQETAFGGAEAAAVEEAGAFGDNSAAAAVTFHPRQDARVESARPMGKTPWTVFRAACLMLAFIWFCGLIFFFIFPDGSIDRKSDEDCDHLPESSLARMTSRAAALEDDWAPALEGEWLLDFDMESMPAMPLLSPVADGLACHSSFGSAILVANRYGVREVTIHDPNDTSDSRNLQRLPCIQRCLAAAPEFQAEGLAGVSLECWGPGNCAAVMLGRQGDSALICPLLPSDACASPATVAPRLVSLSRKGGKGWRSLATVGDTSVARRRWLAIPSGSQEEVVAPTPLSVRFGARGGLRAFGSSSGSQPLSSSSPARTGTRSIASVGSSESVLGLSAGGKLVRAWAEPHALDRPLELGTWRLPLGIRWDALCATEQDIYAVGGVAGGRPQLWRFDVPEELMFGSAL